MSLLCLLVFSICVLHNSLLTLDVFFTEHGCNHWVGWGEFFALQIQHGFYLSIIFLFLLPFLIAGIMIATRGLDVTFSEFLELFLSCMYFLSVEVYLWQNSILGYWYQIIQICTCINSQLIGNNPILPMVIMQTGVTLNMHHKKVSLKGITLKGITCRGFNNFSYKRPLKV